jgi:ferritin
MKNEHIVSLLSEDMKNEYKHHRFYLHSSFVLEGHERLYFVDWLKKQAAEELHHVEEFANKITSFGHIPPVFGYEFPTDLRKMKDILNYAIQMEMEVVDNYHNRLKHFEELSEKTGKHFDLVLHYEDQIEDSQRDVDEMLRMAGSWRA